jgi:hypothetical protein
MSFSMAETVALLHPGDGASRPREVGITLKLAWLGLSYRESVLGRNLRALARRRSAAADS